MSDKNVDPVKRLYAAFGAGDLQSLLGTLDAGGRPGGARVRAVGGGRGVGTSTSSASSRCSARPRR
jgi:hypothetical protein